MIVITGAAGFIGSCILARFNALGYEDIIIVDHLDDPLKKGNLEGKKYRQYYDKKDFLHLVLEDQLDPQVEAVIHMGACSSTTLQDAQYYQENNFEYSCHLAQWCLEHQSRLIYASSAATYGDGSQGYSDSDEATPQYRPLNFYGESKQKFDLWVLDHGLNKKYVGLKFFNVFGPNEYHKGDMRSVIAKAYKDVAEKGKIRLFKSYKPEYADGEQKRDFIYVKDAVDVVMFFYGHPGVTGIFNVGTGAARSWNDLARALFAAVGKKPSIEYFEMPDGLKERYQYFTQAEMSKLRKAGYHKKFTEFEDAVKDYVTYLKDQAHI